MNILILSNVGAIGLKLCSAISFIINSNFVYEISEEEFRRFSNLFKSGAEIRSYVGDTG